MLLARPLIRLMLAPALALALSGCLSLTERAGLPPSVERAETLERAGDSGGAARVYERLASQSSGAERNDLALRAARGYLAAHAREDAARVLAMLEGPLSAEQSTERSLSSIELALERGQNKEAWQQLSALPEPRSGSQAARYRELLARAALAAGGPQERPRVRVYDTGTQSVADALTLATRQGADFIVGPLTREEVAAAAEFPAQHAPLLALNFLSAERPAPPQFYQYALSPEDEARVAARRILEDQHRRGVALVPAGDWGERVLAAFRQELLSGGGELLATAAIDASRTDYSGPITQLLGLSDSTARFKRLEAAIGTKLVFEPRRRGDVEFIFAPAQPSTERLLRPQLRFHYAGDIPTYATSDAFEPDVRANQELDGLMFPDMPWMLGGDLAEAVRAVTRGAWPTGGPYRGRLFAFGFDAFRLAQALRRPGAGSSVGIDGLTGHLSLDAERRVRREITWAQLHNGELRLLPAAGTP